LYGSSDRPGLLVSSAIELAEEKAGVKLDARRKNDGCFCAKLSARRSYRGPTPVQRRTGVESGAGTLLRLRVFASRRERFRSFLTESCRLTAQNEASKSRPTLLSRPKSVPSVSARPIYFSPGCTPGIRKTYTTPRGLFPNGILSTQVRYSLKSMHPYD
jgi:hypothetical protein